MFNRQKMSQWHDKQYKRLLLIPAILILLCIVYLVLFYNANGDFVRKDITLTGGTSITVYDATLSADEVATDLETSLENLNIRRISDVFTREQKALIIETTVEGDEARTILENYLGYPLTEDNSSIEFTGASLSQSFYKQLLIAILIAFVFMAIVVFIIFRKAVPSLAVIISAFADIFMTLTLFNLFGMQLSTAGIVAFLMLIGYSVDTDILLTTRILKRHEGTVNQRLFEAFKTGIMMTGTSIVAVSVALLVVSSFSVVLSQILTILLIGLIFDVFNTWITNASLIKWYVEKK